MIILCFEECEFSTVQCHENSGEPHSTTDEPVVRALHRSEVAERDKSPVIHHSCSDCSQPNNHRTYSEFCPRLPPARCCQSCAPPCPVEEWPCATLRLRYLVTIELKAPPPKTKGPLGDGRPQSSKSCPRRQAPPQAFATSYAPRIRTYANPLLTPVAEKPTQLPPNTHDETRDHGHKLCGGRLRR